MELAEAVGASKEHVRLTLQRLADDGIVKRRPGVAEHGADIYRASREALML